MGLEGLVLKNVNGIYEPGKRHWLKVKKDYLFDGRMADSADLVVLGAWFGTGKMGGILSVFLMGCYDAMVAKWKTVTKVHTGMDDKTMDKVHVSVYYLSVNVSMIPFLFLYNIFVNPLKVKSFGTYLYGI